MLYPIELRAQQRDSTARLDRGEIRRLVPSRSGGRVMKLEHPEPFVCRWHAKWMWNTRPALQLDTATRMVLADATEAEGHEQGERQELGDGGGNLKIRANQTDGDSEKEEENRRIGQILQNVGVHRASPAKSICYLFPEY